MIFGNASIHPSARRRCWWCRARNGIRRGAGHLRPIATLSPCPTPAIAPKGRGVEANARHAGFTQADRLGQTTGPDDVLALHHLDLERNFLPRFPLDVERERVLAQLLVLSDHRGRAEETTSGYVARSGRFGSFSSGNCLEYGTRRPSGR